MNDNEFIEMLETTKLSKANSKRSKKLFIMRTILIDKYINRMSREEICAELDFISLSTYTDYLKEAKKVITSHPWGGLFFCSKIGRKYGYKLPQIFL